MYTTTDYYQRRRVRTEIESFVGVEEEKALVRVRRKEPVVKESGKVMELEVKVEDEDHRPEHGQKGYDRTDQPLRATLD